MHCEGAVSSAEIPLDGGIEQGKKSFCSKEGAEPAKLSSTNCGDEPCCAFGQSAGLSRPVLVCKPCD